MPYPDPFQAHLNRAASLFEAGDVVQAGQIWQAIVKRDPSHQAARAGLYRVKEFFDQSDLNADSERLVSEGCTLFDMGQVRDALQKWERILANEPKHKLALAYANDARRDLGLPPLPAPREEAQPAQEAPRADANQLVLEGIQIYDMGMEEEAIAKWQRALELNPQHPDAPAYLQMARRDQEQEARPRPASPVAAESHPAPSLETRIWRAEQLLRDWRLEEAVQAFQLLLDQGPQDDRIVQGYHQARSLLTAQDEPRGAITLTGSPAPAAIPPPVGPPKALTVRSPAPRNGFRLPGALDGLRLPGLLHAPRNLVLATSLVLLGLLGLIVFGVRRREAALREAVAAAKTSALKPVSRMVQIPSLPEALADVRREGEAALGEDPLLAYFRAQEWQRRDPDDPAAVLLVQRSRDKLTVLVPSATLADFDKALQVGDLEGARRCIFQLLRHDPDDLDLRGRARKVLLALAPRYADDDRMGKAQEVLRQGRAMFPQDLTWQARLKLLEALQAMAKSDRTPWIQLLG